MMTSFSTAARLLGYALSCLFFPMLLERAC
jgi:hypothetical protein